MNVSSEHCVCIENVSWSEGHESWNTIILIIEPRECRSCYSADYAIALFEAQLLSDYYCLTFRMGSILQHIKTDHDKQTSFTLTLIAHTNWVCSLSHRPNLTWNSSWICYQTNLGQQHNSLLWRKIRKWPRPSPYLGKIPFREPKDLESSFLPKCSQ